MSAPRCPHCEGRDLEPCDAVLDAGDETVRATHECRRCHTRFRYVPPAPQPERRSAVIRSLVALAAVFALACGSALAPPQSDLERQARAALSCPVGTLTWSTDGGTIDQAGNFTAPPCAAPYTDATYHVSVSGCGNSATIPIVVSDSLKSVAVYCGEVLPETCCRVPPLTVAPGAQIQWFAALQYNCDGHVTYSSTPPALCP